MSLLEVLKAEAKLIFSDVAIVLTIIGGVILYAFLYPQPYAKESVSALHVSVVDLDKSDVSRDIIFKLNATAQVDVTREDSSQKDAINALQENKIEAIFIIPKHFKRDLNLKISPTIAVGADNSYFLIYGAVLQAAMKSVLTYSAKIKVANLLKEKIPISSAKQAYTPYSINTINLFNKNNSYTQYVIPAVFILILQQTLLIGLGILGGRVNEDIKNRNYSYYLKAKTYQIIFSRTLIFATIFLLHMLFYFGFVYEYFHITHLAHIADLLSFGVIFILAAIAFGIFLGSLFKSREIATPTILFSSLPLVFSVGFVWPIETIPPYIYNIALLVPSTTAINGFLKLNQMGADFDMIIDNYLILVVQIIVYTTLGYYLIDKKIYGQKR
jgi:ABC-2 type transport system permease protein